MRREKQSARRVNEAAEKRLANQRASLEAVVPREPAVPIPPGQRALTGVGRARPADILALQRTVGNRAVSRLIQTKLTVGPAGDRYEQEADHVAEQVLTMPLPSPARRGLGGEVQRQDEEPFGELQAKPLAATITPLVQRQEEEEELQMTPVAAQQVVQRQEEEEKLQMTPLIQRQEEEELQAKPQVQRQEDEELQMAPVAAQQVVQRRAGGSLEAGPNLENSLAAHKGSGSPLPEETRAYMEPRFGADFSGVRVHTGGEAVQMNKELKAQAFTHGQDIYLGTGRYDPGSTAGKRLLAHELTHVVQQGGAQVQARSESAGAREASATADISRYAPTQESQPEIQRLPWQNTNWADATEVKASGSGARGVLFVKDETADPPVVVKSGQMMDVEVPLAANIHQQVLGGGQGPQEWGASVPGARVVSQDEGRTIKTALSDKVQGNERAENVLERTDQPGTLVFQYATGVEFGKALGLPLTGKSTKKHSKKKGFLKRMYNKLRGKSTRTMRSASALNVFLDPGFWTTMGKVSAVDIFTGNRDRLIGLFNLANFLVDMQARTIGVIDNVHLWDQSAFIGYQAFGMDPDRALGIWVNDRWTKLFCEEDYEGLFNKVCDDALIPSIETDYRAKDQRVFKRKFNKRKGQLENAYVAGLAAGKNRLIAVLKDNTESLVAGVPEDKQAEALISLRGRLMYLVTGRLPTKPSRESRK
jgi:hypothetical protein